ncbi:hypothetical protein SAMN05421749_103290 [Acinetobacter marinus]|uniref:Morphogenetic protein n=1 Tax=Acinetobacter marinus TaxID=281375 RepID=A0A1G6JA13_9GAMM|nr:hypothetical protein [Acinetobacter marinus]SDC15624.1 hypothetical protein SAMN05421749_103290 [Acinetobacter marinus]
MKERPILFKTEMVQAILKGRKTQTRRVLKAQPPVKKNRVVPLYQVEHKVTEVSFHEILKDDIPHCSSFFKCKSPFGKIGDRLWVRETFCYAWNEDDHICDKDGNPVWDVKDAHIYYAASETKVDGKWKPSIHMPRWASRILLEITNIQVERLNDVSESDCVKEGVGSAFLRDCKKPKFMQLWESINGADSWAENPWVWVIEFRVVRGDQ